MLVTLNSQERDEVIDALRYKTQSLIKRIQYLRVYTNSKQTEKELKQKLDITRKMYNQLKDHFNIVIDDSITSSEE